MTKKPHNYSIRTNTLTDTFASAAQRGYLDHLSVRSAIDNFDGDRNGSKLHELRENCLIAGLQTIVFAVMCFESAIYEYAAGQLGDKYVRHHLDKLSLLSKWEVCLRRIAGYEIPKDQAPYRALKQLISARNRLVHFKSEPVEKDIAGMADQITRLKAENKKLVQDVDNAFRAMVLMSAELERVLDIHSPLPHFNDKLLSSTVIPEALKNNDLFP